MVQFNQIQPGLLPFVQAEFDSSGVQAGPSALTHHVLLIGQLLSTGNQAADTPLLLTNAGQAREAFGPGSQLAQMAAVLFENDQTTAVTAIGLDDPAGAQATATLAFTGTATKAGSVAVYVGGVRVQAAVSATDPAAVVATAVAAAITGNADLPVTAAAVTGTVTLTAKHDGLIGNDLFVAVNVATTETLPAGLALTVGTFSGGAGSPDLAAALGAIGSTWYTVWALGLSDDPSIAAVETELEALFDPDEARDAIAFYGFRGTHGEALTKLGGRNSRHTSIMAAERAPTPPWQWASAIAGKVVRSVKNDPARPFKSLDLRGVQGPAAADLFANLERELLLQAGGATFTAATDGTIRIERLVTTYKENEAGAPDAAWRDARTLFTLAYLRFDLVTRIQLGYSRHKVMADGAILPTGQALTTPKLFAGFVDGVARQWAEAGLIEDLDGFSEALVVVIDPSNPDRINVLMQPNLVNALYQVAVQIQFQL